MSEVVACYPDDPDRQSQNLFGLIALVRELARQDVPREAVFAGSGIVPEQLDDPAARMSRRQRLIIYRNAVKLARVPQIGLLAGAGQRLGDFGVYGYAFANFETLGEAILFTVRNMTLASPLLEVRYRETDGGIVLSSHGCANLGDLLVFAAEYWRSSMVTLVSHALERRLSSKLMTFPFPAPAWWREYQNVFECRIEFEADTMEWHFENPTLDLPLPGANRGSARTLEAVCAQLIPQRSTGTGIARKIRTICRDNAIYPSATEMADRLHMSTRSMFRRLAAEACSYQLIIDDVRRDTAMAMLRDHAVSIEEIGQRLGYSETTNFGKAFRRWAGMAPSEYRAGFAVADSFREVGGSIN